MNDDTKHFLQSKTFWAAFAVILLSTLKTFHKVPDDLDATQVGDSLYNGAIAIFGVFAVVGRLFATTQLTILPTSKDDNTPNGSLTKTTNALLLLVIFSIGLAVGCSQTQNKVIGNTTLSIDGLTTATTALLESGHLSVETAQKLHDDLLAAQAAVKAWNAARLAGNTDVASKARQSALGAIDALQKEYSDAQAATAPATLPS